MTKWWHEAIVKIIKFLSHATKIEPLRKINVFSIEGVEKFFEEPMKTFGEFFSSKTKAIKIWIWIWI